MLNKQNLQTGQTLIETIVAIFILTTAITAGLALTIYVLANSGQSLNEIIATNLAREGVEMVRNMRDTNWLESDAIGGIYALATCNDSNISAQDFSCYPKAWDGVSGTGYHNYDLKTDGNYSLIFNLATKSWTFTRNPTSYGLYLQSDGTYGTTPTGGPVFARKIKISHVTNTGSFGSGSNSELVVTSIVGWSGKNCTSMGVNPDPENTNCNVAETVSLTNWKDY